MTRPSTGERHFYLELPRDLGDLRQALAPWLAALTHAEVAAVAEAVRAARAARARRASCRANQPGVSP